MISKLCNIFSTVILLAVILVAGALVVPKFLGFTPMAVLSGSMEPFYHVGSLIYINTKVEPEEIQVGDPITFTLSGDTVVTHRVIARDDVTEEFRTKGDANQDEDMAPVPYDTLLGLATLSIPLLGYVALAVKTGKGIAICCGIGVVLIILFLIPVLLKKETPEEKSNKKMQR